MSADHIEAELAKSANDALDQIDKNQNISLMKQEGITEFLKTSNSFYKKHVKLVSKTEKLHVK